MFTILESKSETRTVSQLVGFAVVACMVAVLLVAPLVYTQELKAADLKDRFLVPPPPPPPPPHVEVFTKKPEVRTKIEVSPNDFIAPPSIPTDIILVDEPPEIRPGVNFVQPSQKVCIRCLMNSADTSEAIPPPPPPPPPAPPVQRVRVGGSVTQANLLVKVQPVYPALAKQARIQGIVVLEAEISAEGNIDNLRVISGHPLLIQAAMDAVIQWKYKPTLLNGEAVQVVTTITVNFAFAQ